jgi:hypothetical protein
MRELPIIFNIEMVLAILDGRKTVTRRPIKGDPKRLRWEGFVIAGEYGFRDEHGRLYRCPFGEIGDLLYVRETWRVGAWDEDNGEIAFDYKADGQSGKYVELEDDELFSRLWEQSCEDAEKEGCEVDENERYSWCRGESPCRWRPSIHMPKAAARIWLEIADIRVERVQNITEDQAIKEGIIEEEFYPDDGYPLSVGYTHEFEKVRNNRHRCLYNKARIPFSHLWDDVYNTWDANPWVWVIEFKRIEK